MTHVMELVALLQTLRLQVWEQQEARMLLATMDHITRMWTAHLGEPGLLVLNRHHLSKVVVVITRLLIHVNKMDVLQKASILRHSQLRLQLSQCLPFKPRHHQLLHHLLLYLLQFLHLQPHLWKQVLLVVPVRPRKLHNLKRRAQQIRLQTRLSRSHIQHYRSVLL